MPKPSVELNTALDAISADLDAMGDEIATIAGGQADLSDAISETTKEVRAVGHQLASLIDLVRMRILPATDEIDNLRARVQAVEDRADRYERQRAGLDAE